ncbi:RDD family protein [Streptomyces sp. NPDC048483]|uniref:RDD family protein n=1 Tax=Streptomyces sp. NPDC048483 TaxID=3154927 RepID=UPI003427A6A3
MNNFQPPPPPGNPHPGFGPAQPQYGPPQAVPPQPIPHQPVAPQAGAPFYAPPQPLPPQTMQPQGPPRQALAVPGLRLLARFIDSVIISAMLVVAVRLTTGFLHHHPEAEVPVVAAMLAWLLFAAVLFEPLTTAMGGTLGKAVCGLRVIRLETGRKVGFGIALGRWLAYLGMGMVPVLGLINVLSCIWNEPFRQCMHDRAANTVVVKRRWQ